VKAFWILSALALAACTTTDKNLVASGHAAWVYHDARYQKLCLAVVGPPKCKDYRAALDEMNFQNVVGNKVQQEGGLPPEERKAIKKAKRALRGLP